MGVRLPPEYQEVEYLGNTGTQYIVTDYVPSADNVEVDLKYMFTASQRSDSMLFGSSTGYTTAKTYQCEKYNGGSWYIAVGRSNYRDVLGEYGGSMNAIHFIHADADILKIDDGSTAPSTFRSGDNQLPMALFAWTTKADGTVTYINKGARIYAITFKENGVLTADYVPCYRKSDSKPGMYDTVSHKFYMNEGTGEFLVGPNVYRRLPAEYQEVEYLKSTGTQYIDLGLNSPMVNGCFSVKTMIDYDTPGNTQLLGCNTDNRNKLPKVSIENTNFNLRQSSNKGMGSSLRGSIVVMTSDRNGNVYVNNVKRGTINTVSRTGNGYYLFSALPSYMQYAAKARIYSFNVWDDEKQFIDLIPCYRKFDSKPGMYDLVSGTFFTNAGTGEFLVGGDVIDSISPWLIARRMMLMQKIVDTRPKIAEYGKYLNRSATGTTVDSSWCYTEWYDIDPHPSTNSIIDNVTNNNYTFQYVKSNGPGDYWYGPSRNLAGTPVKIRFSMTIAKLNAGTEYAYSSTTGQIFFAGRNTQYYGYTNINDMPSGT